MQQLREAHDKVLRNIATMKQESEQLDAEIRSHIFLSLSLSLSFLPAATPNGFLFLLRRAYQDQLVKLGKR
jgi:hypothetical protein